MLNLKQILTTSFTPNLNFIRQNHINKRYAFNIVRGLGYEEESPEIRKKRAEALRKAYKIEKKRVINDPDSWWNLMKTQDTTQFMSMPKADQKKIERLSELYATHFEEDRVYRDEIDPKYQQHRTLVTLITNKERERDEYLRSLQIDGTPSNPVVPSPNANHDDFMKVQPRNINIPNYNFEQYRGFTKVYNEQMQKDQEKQYELKRMLKYINANHDTKKSQSFKAKLLFKNVEGHHLVYDMSHLVDESVNIEGYQLPTKNRSRRKIIKDRTSRDISNYSAWRVIDRQLIVEKFYKQPISKLLVSPAELIHWFGDPHMNMARKCSGYYVFEDNDLDLYTLAEPNLTLYEKDINKSDEYYEEQKKLHIK